METRFFERNDIKKAIAIHVSFFLTLSLNSFSNYLDDKNKIKKANISSKDVAVIADVVDYDQYEKIRNSVQNNQDNYSESNINLQQTSDSVVSSKQEVVKFNEKEVSLPKKNNKIVQSENKIKQNQSLQQISKNQELENKYHKNADIAVNQNIDTSKFENKVDQEISQTSNTNEENLKNQNSDAEDILNQLNSYNSTKIENGSEQKNYNSEETVQGNYLSNIRYQVELCWSKYAIGKRKNQITVQVEVSYNQMGKMLSYSIITNGTTREYELMKNDAIKALQDCNPLKGIKQENPIPRMIFNFRYY
jgi:hypothetical protein